MTPHNPHSDAKTSHISFHVASLPRLTRTNCSEGKLESDGTMHITLCNFIKPWESTSDTQRKSLTQRYAMGCDCKVKSKWLWYENFNLKENAFFCKTKALIFWYLFLKSDIQIIRCTSVPCSITSPAECLWLDWVIERTVDGEQAKHFACIKRSDDSCAWYRGAAPPKREFLDIEDP